MSEGSGSSHAKEATTRMANEDDDRKGLGLVRQTAAEKDLAAGKLVYVEHMAEHGAPADGWDRLHPGAKATYVRVGRKRRLGHS